MILELLSRQYGILYQGKGCLISNYRYIWMKLKHGSGNKRSYRSEKCILYNLGFVRTGFSLLFGIAVGLVLMAGLELLYQLYHRYLKKYIDAELR